MTQCNGATGAIFCNGNYVNASDVDQCIAALNGVLSVQISATGSSSCGDDDCNAQGSVTTKTSCSASPGGQAGGEALFAFGAVFAAIAVARRRARS
jgi:MYXO-CTERM domain-containing protein